MVNVLLNAFAPVARCQGTTGSAGEQTGLHALSLSVIGTILDNGAPFAVDVPCSDRPSVQDLARADVTGAANPVALLESLAAVQRVIKAFLFERVHSLHEIVGRLVSNFGVFLENYRIVIDGVLQLNLKLYYAFSFPLLSSFYLDLAFRIVIVFQTKSGIDMLGAFRWGSWVAIIAILLLFVTLTVSRLVVESRRERGLRIGW